MVASARICPQCKSPTINRSHRTMLERLMPGLKAYRCYGCNYRFTVRRANEKSRSMASTA